MECRHYGSILDNISSYICKNTGQWPSISFKRLSSATFLTLSKAWLNLLITFRYISWVLGSLCWVSWSSHSTITYLRKMTHRFHWQKRKKRRRHFRSPSCSESHSPVQIVGERRVLASTGDEEGAQVLLQGDTFDNSSRISIVSNCFFPFKTAFFSVTFRVSYLKVLAVGSFLAFLRCGRGSRCARQDLGTAERDNQ